MFRKGKAARAGPLGQRGQKGRAGGHFGKGQYLFFFFSSLSSPPPVLVRPYSRQSKPAILREGGSMLVEGTCTFYKRVLIDISFFRPGKKGDYFFKKT